MIVIGANDDLALGIFLSHQESNPLKAVFPIRKVDLVAFGLIDRRGGRKSFSQADGRTVIVGSSFDPTISTDLLATFDVPFATFTINLLEIDKLAVEIHWDQQQ